MFEMADKEKLEYIKAALTDPNLSDKAAIFAALSFLGGLVEPTEDDINWAKNTLKEMKELKERV